MDEIGQEKRRISERLARLDAERTRLGDQLKELEIAERVLTRFGGKADTKGGRRSGRPARTAPAISGERRAPRRPESAQLDDPRRLFEGCAGQTRLLAQGGAETHRGEDTPGRRVCDPDGAAQAARPL